MDKEVEYKVRRENDYYVVEGADLERLIHSVNFEDLDSIHIFKGC